MAVYPLNFPIKAPASEKLQLNHRQAVAESPHSLKIQVVNTASQWMLELGWNRMSIADAYRVQAFLDSLQGQVGTFRYTPRFALIKPLNARTLALPLSYLGTTAQLAGWTANAPSDLEQGQIFSIGNQLMKITAAAAQADADGKVVIEFAPAARQLYPAGTAINFAAPSGLFRLASSETPSFTGDIDRAPSFPVILAKEAM